MRCRDKSLRYLQRQGYNVVRHPQEGIAPMGLIGHRKGGVSYLGHLSDSVLDQSIAPPKVETDLKAAEISGQSTNSIAANLGLTILGAIFSGLGGNINANASYKSAKKLVFQFHDVFKDRVAPLKLDAYLRQAEFNRKNIVMQPFLDEGRVLLITETIKANEFSVEATNENGQSLDIDVPAIQNAAEGKIEVSRDAAKQSALTYKGAKFLTFGFQCFEVAYDNGELRLVSTKPGTAYMGGPVSDETGDPEPEILFESELLSIEMASD